ncbi:hypothetical protein KM043_002487 [Ampulex compressa]|nr:hypothetical protein KM043_002487 [Ampulex compressa]
MRYPLANVTVGVFLKPRSNIPAVLNEEASLIVSHVPDTWLASPQLETHYYKLIGLMSKEPPLPWTRSLHHVGVPTSQRSLAPLARLQASDVLATRNLDLRFAGLISALADIDADQSSHLRHSLVISDLSSNLEQGAIRADYLTRALVACVGYCLTLELLT